ncbi:uncharacterized protein LOC110184305 [Drosophila serrata]|uniref:uncharacterized protein LOC110184305 n=1 Tax=Drosophila serrata TaxID=7274 RepID=UPI000A1D0A09|nr:uncharacterized protein LOC110184305 [Drosophila serrata]
MQWLGLGLLTLTVALVALVAGHAIEEEIPPSLAAHAYGPAIRISSGILQLAPDSEQPQLLLVPHVHSSSLSYPWPHFYVDTLTASHLPHSSMTPVGGASDSIHEPRILVNDNVDFSQTKLPKSRVVHSHGR